jgi:hypothetical protein
MQIVRWAIGHLLALVILTPCSAAVSDPLAALREDLYERGRDTCNDGKWADALPIHERLTRLDPDYGFGWMGLGWSRQYTGDFAHAIPAYQRALQLGGMPASRIHLQIAECLASMGKEAEALQELDQAVQSGLPGLEQLMTKKPFAALRTHPTFGARFRALAEAVDVRGLTHQKGWEMDLDLLKKEVLRLHYNPLRKMTRTELDQAIEDIKSSIAAKSDEQIAVDVMRFMRRLGDGHTWARIKEQAFGEEQGIPILIHEFADGFFVTGTDQHQADLVGARITQIEGQAPQEMLAKLDTIVSCDNAMGLLSQGPWVMRFPTVLHGLGLCRSPAELHLRVNDSKGRIRDVVLSPAEPLVKPIRTPAEKKQALPIHFKRRPEPYWFERIPDSKVMYFEYNACRELDDKPLGKFADELFDQIESSDADTLIVDLRWNSGGNLFVSRPLLSRLLQCRKVLKPGNLFVIAGRHTFSAGMVFAAQIERYTPAIFVGEPTGSSPNFVGETNLITLPYSKMIVSISNLYWQNSSAMDTRPWISPKIRTPMSFAMWKQGRDEAVEAVLRYKLNQ